MASSIGIGGLVLIGAAAISAVLLVWLQPVLERYALARPNARSSHKKPTPQGGGIAVIAAAVIVLAAAAFVVPEQFAALRQCALVLAAVVLLAAIGAADDMRALAPLLRLFFQAVAVVIMLAALSPDLRLVPAIPWWLERAALFVAALWLVNVANFMDGIDWMTVAEFVPITAALAAFGVAGVLPHEGMLTAFALCGALLGFAPFNRPVARIFLGDVGSLPLGLLLAWLLILLSAQGHLVAALLLPLYYLADATITLLRRLANGEPIMQAHRRHHYQQALDGGMDIRRILAFVLTLNLALIALAAASIAARSLLVDALTLLAGCALVALVLWRFARGK